MGWGVQQNEAFPQVIEEMTGTKTLNAGIASYGTVREMMMLDRIDTSGLKYLIIQYNDNDFEENKAFYEQGQLQTSSYEAYQRICNFQGKLSRYYPGKNLTLIWRGLQRKISNPLRIPQNDLTGLRDADYFLHALRHATKVDLSHVNIVVIVTIGFF